MQFAVREFSKGFNDVPDSKTELLVFAEQVPFHQLSEAGFVVFRKLENNAVIGSFQEVSRPTRLHNYTSYTTNSLWKLSESLLRAYTSSTKLQGKYWVKVRDDANLMNYFRNEKAISVVTSRDSYYLLKIEGLPIEQLIQLDELIYIGKESSSAKNEANVLDLNLHPNRINAVHHLYPELQGEGEIISIKEPYYNIADIDLVGRYTPSGLESDFIDGHATQMATIAVGAGNSFITGKGVAAKAQHTSSSNAMVVPDDALNYQNLDIQVQNHSYGTEIEPFYGAMAALFDESTHNNANLLHIFSSGNSGNSSPVAGTYAGVTGFSNLTGNFKHAKNILTVGSVDTTGTPIAMASKGPSYDGRIKPELVTYSMAGTSNSAALVSGTALLLQQRFKAKTGSAMPAALLKGMLINSADDVFNKGLDFSTGYGQLNALRAVENLDNGQYLSGTMQNGSEANFLLDIPPNAINLKVTLIWTDPPANANDELALVNDLDLRIIAPDASVILPSVLSTNPSSLNNIASPGIDRINNVEQVVVPDPLNGGYSIEVEGYSVREITQDFFVLYQWDIANQFRWTSPTGSDNISYNGSTTSHLRWESSFGPSEGSLFYKILVGEEASEWVSIDSEINLEKEQYRWDAPDIFNLAILKMEIEGAEYLSDTFSLSTPLRLGVGFNCSDSISLQWKPAPNVESYKIQTLFNHQMQTITTTSSTHLVLDKSDFTSDYFKIIPYINDEPILESFTIDYQLQGAGCFLNTFFVNAVQDSGIFTSIRLGALSGIKEIFFQKLKRANNWETFNVQKPTQLNYRILDSDPSDGLNTYRVQIHFENNTIITSDIGSAYYVNNQPFIVYPNPVDSNETLFVFSKFFEGTYQFKLYNLAGQLTYGTEISDNRAFIELPALHDGVYFYLIFQDNSLLAKSKLVVGR